jgi:hypothetical protein
MSLARSLTKRLKRSDAAPTPSRSMSVKNAKISSPVALLSTTNMLSYNAPDIATLKTASVRQAHSSTVSTHSADDSDNSASTTRSRSSSQVSRDTLTDASSVGSSPTSPSANHLSGFFPSSKVPRRSASSSNLQAPKAEVDELVPAIPERALSHSKRAHERLAQKRSLQSMNSRGSIRSARSSREHRTSADMFNPTILEEAHPFGKELEQLNEVAEEFGGVVRDAEVQADMAVLREKKLATFCAADYLREIQPLFNSRFANPHRMAWI